MRPLTVALSALLCSSPATAHAQSRIAIGGRMGYDDLAKAAALGVEMHIRIAPALTVRPSIDLFIMEFGSYRAFNLDLQYALSPALYLGGGLASRWFRASDVAGDVLGTNLFAGVMIPGGEIRPFAEVGAFLKDGFHGNGRIGLSVQL